MADTAFPPFTKATGATDSPVGQSSQYGLTGGGPDLHRPLDRLDPEARVRRLVDRFFFAWQHPKWEKWRRAAEEDWGFYTGEGQWDERTRQQLEADGRVVLTINEVRPVLGVIVGYERGARLEMKPVAEATGTSPPSEATKESVRVFAHLFKKVSKDQEADFVNSEVFKDGVVGGLGAWYMGVDYSEDLIHGRPEVVKLRRGEFLYDPESQKYDLSDARECFWHKMVPIESLLARYPDHADLIDAALGQLPQDAPYMSHELPARDPWDGYRTDRFSASIPLYSPRDRSIRVVEAWYQTWQTTHLLVNHRRNTVEEVPDDPEARAAVRELARMDPEGLEVIRKQRRLIQMSVFLPATRQELAHGNPFDNDLEDYPFVKFQPYADEDELIGIVRNLKDPQREVNKRRSAVVDNIVRHGYTKWFATRETLENPEFLEGTGEVGWLRVPGQLPQEVSPPDLPGYVRESEEISKQEIREIAMVPAPAQGQSDARASGLKVARLQAAAQVGVSEVFDNYRRSRRLVGKRMGKRIQQVYTGPMIVRFEPEAGQTEFVTINETEIDPEGRVSVVRDIPSLRWDMEITDSPATPTARAAMLGGLIEFIQSFPDYKDAMADLVIEASDLPREALDRVRQIQAAKAGQPPGSPHPQVVQGGRRLPAGGRRIMERIERAGAGGVSPEGQGGSPLLPQAG